MDILVPDERNPSRPVRLAEDGYQRAFTEVATEVCAILTDWNAGVYREPGGQNVCAGM